MECIDTKPAVRVAFVEKDDGSMVFDENLGHARDSLSTHAALTLYAI